MHDAILLLIEFVIGIPGGIELNRWRVRHKWLKRLEDAADRMTANCEQMNSAAFGINQRDPDGLLHVKYAEQRRKS